MSTNKLPQIEIRSFGKPLELRKLDKKGFIGTLAGYAIVYGVESRDMGGWREIIAKEAFTESLRAGKDVRMLYQHSSAQIMARESAGTLRLREDEEGVFFEADLTDTQLNRDAYLNVEQRNLDAMSFGMPYASVVARWERAPAPKKYDLRTVTKADVVEISLVTWAAYEDTTVAARDWQEFQKSEQKPTVDAATSVRLHRNRLEHEKLRFRS